MVAAAREGVLRQFAFPYLQRTPFKFPPLAVTS